MSFVDFPYHLDVQGRSARTDPDDHVRDLIEQVLFTAPGERVNRPTFGTGLRQLVFAPADDELAAATQFLVQGALQQWLGDRITVEEVRAEAGDGDLRVAVRYRIKRTDERRVERFVAPSGAGPGEAGFGL
jgi:phage baseplate assembly protein W